MPRLMVAFLTGLLFATGLVLARMTRPDVVLGFLDVAGDWNPALALVMLGAVVTFGLLYRVSVRRGRPLLAGTLVLPRRNDLDARLFAGTAVFGLGWGLVGVCPGPAVTALASGASSVIVFVLAMAAGIKLAEAGVGQVQPARDRSTVNPCE